MTPFRFRLESLLRLREAARDASRVQLAQLLADQHRLRAEQQALEQQLAESRRHDREQRQSTAFALELLRQADSRRQALASELGRIVGAATLVARQFEACQQQLAMAECEYQAVAKLRASRLAEHHRAALREESKLADEAAGRAFRRTA